MSTLWSADVTAIGPDAGDMIDGGVVILFGEPVPEALAEVSIVHRTTTALTRDITAGDVFRIAGRDYTVDAVGERACANLTELGHVVVYVNQPEQELLPDAVLATGPRLVAPTVGGAVEFLEA